MEVRSSSRGFSMTYDVIRDKLSLYGKIVYVELKAIFYSGSQATYVSQRTLARLCGISRGKLIEVLNELEDKGLIKRTRGNHGDHEADKFTLDDDALAVMLDPDGSYTKSKRFEIEDEF